MCQDGRSFIPYFPLSKSEIVPNYIDNSPHPVFSCPVCGTETRLIEAQLGGFNIYCCPGCGLRFAPDAFSISINYDAVYDEEEYRATQLHDIARFANDPLLFAKYTTYRPFFEHVRHKNDMRLLDVGYGVGRFTPAADALGWDVTGIDVSKKAIDIAQQYVKFPVHCLTLDQVKQCGGHFNVITAFEVLEHLSQPLVFLHLCREVLTDKRQLFCTVPNWDCTQVQTAARIDWVPPIHLCFYTQSSLQTAGQRAGYGSIKTGIIPTDPLPQSLLDKARWLKRRLLGVPRQPLGLWMYAQM